MDPHALDCYRRAGTIAADCREWARSEVRPGLRLRDLLEGVEARIADAGAAPAFPTQSSRNEIAAHHCSSPDDEETYEEGDCAKVDIGVHIDGYVADTAITVDLSRDGRWSALIGASSDALDAAIAEVRGGVSVGQLGAVVEKTITDAGFQPIRNLAGHGLDRWTVHCPPQIPNYAEPTAPRLQSGSVIAIEPFASTGVGHVEKRGSAEVFMLTRSPRRRKGLDRRVLGAIQSWRGLPIARRYFNHLDRAAVEKTFRQLIGEGALAEFADLAEAPGVMTAQTEHTIYITEDGPEILTLSPA